jgi:hypothetical protein
MKKMIVMAIALMTGAIVAAKANVNVVDVKAVYQQDDKEKFRAEINEKIEKNKERIAELRAEAKKDKDKMDAKAQKKIDDLEARNNKLRDKLNSYDGKSNWVKFKEEVNHDANELGTAIADVFKDNKK